MSGQGAIHLSDDRLVDLECGLLDAPARAAAVEHLRRCRRCESRLAEVHADARRLEARGEPAAALRPAAVAAARAAGRRRLLGAAAAGIFLVGMLAIYGVSRRPPPDGLDYWLPLDSERLLLRSAAAPAETERYLEALEAYGRRDVKQVIRLLGAGPIPKAYDPLHLVLASALIWDGRHEEARSLLERLDVETLPQPARDRARWMLYVALRRGGSAEQAAAVARLLASAPGEFSERARAEVR